MGSNAQQFCLKWNNHQANMLAVFERLLGNKSLVDVTLGCEGRQMKAHKVVLSACSPFFEGLFTENPCKHPIVILKDIRYADLKALVEFMYKGEVNVVQEQLPTLLKTAEALKIKGLAEVTGESKDDSGGGSSNSQQQQARSAANATPRPESPNSGRRKRQRARRRSTDSAGAGDGLSDSEESVPKTSRTDLQDESSMDGASSHDDGSQASLQRASKKETAPVQTNVDSTSSPASASASAKNSRSAEQTTATNKSAANSNGQVPSSKDTGGGDFEPSRLLEASMTTDQGGDDSTDNLNNTTGPDNNSTNNELDIKPLITLDEGGATPTGAIVPASAAAAAALAGADALSSLFPQGASTAAALAGTSFQNSPPSHACVRADLIVPVSRASNTVNNNLASAAVATFNPSTSTSTNLTSAMNTSGTLSVGAMGAPGLSNYISCNGYDRLILADAEGNNRCLVCNYTVKHRRNIYRHILTHTGDKPFQCELCSFRSSRSDKLKHHVKTKHFQECAGGTPGAAAPIDRSAVPVGGVQEQLGLSGLAGIGNLAGLSGLLPGVNNENIPCGESNNNNNNSQNNNNNNSIQILPID